jgi:fatty-acyl-CoA synthase
VHIVDRKKDIIISGGENISSLEVERAISAYAAVLECAVVSAPDENWGEIPVAFIVWRPESGGTPEALMEFLSVRVAKFKLPRRFECVPGPLPKTGTGKIMKRELRESFWSGKETRVQG